VQIKATTNYDLFTLLDYNRPCDDIAALEKNILQCNKLEMSPIIVDKNFNIIDGQHRYLVAKKNNLILYYRVDQTADCEKDIITYNKASKIWKIDDYIHFYSKKGHKTAVFLQEMLDNHPVTCNEIIRLFVAGSRHKSPVAHVKNGEITLTKSESDIRNILLNLKQILDLVKEKLNQTFYSNQKNTLISIMSNKKYDHVHFMSQIDKYAGEFSKAISVYRDKSQFRKRVIEFVYNRNVKNERKRLTD